MSSLLRSACCLALVCASVAQAAPESVPFDFSHHAIGLQVQVEGKPLYVLLDTGVDPSIIDAQRAQALGLPVQKNQGGEGQGEGNGTTQVYPATIRNLQVGTHAIGDVEALAMDMGGLSKHYGRSLDGVLGYSFLKDKTVVIDYLAHTLTILPSSNAVASAEHACRRRYEAALVLHADSHVPIVKDFRFGTVTVSISLDTGSNRGISLYPAALHLDAIKAALVRNGSTTATGARGSFTTDTARLNLDTGIGPFGLPAGSEVTLMPKDQAWKTTANIGNPVFADMKARLVLDYAGQRLGLYGDCGG